VKDAGGTGKSLSGKKFLKAEKVTTKCLETGKELDLGFVGNIIDVDTEGIKQALNKEILPVIPPLAIDNEGNTYNINADIAACQIAKALKARKLVFLSDVPGILRDQNNEESVISTITVDEVDDLIKRNIISGGMAPKIKSAEEALLAGTNKVHIIDGRIKHSLMLEIFTDRGIGTEIVKKR
jgi:acetylglutamate kinase